MLLNRQKFLTRYGALGIPASALLLGILQAHAVPAGKKFVPLKTPISKKQVASLKTRTGEQIYSGVCASCHGAKGEGGKGYGAPLTGEESVGGLAGFIKQSMPPGNAPKLPAEDARKVAEFIHGAFYSPLAQARNKPARVELSRLTVRQYRNAVTDLIGSFRNGEQPTELRGLRAKYFKTRQGGTPALERVDPEVRFDFGTSGAIPEQDDPYQFVNHWQGSVLAPDTGEYEFIVRTDQAASLWLNNLQQPLIDAQVKSGNSNEYRGSIFLMGGRLYPLRLEFYKGVRGVDNLKKLKEKPVQPAFISFEWKMPHRAVEVIPQRNLFPVTAARAFVVTTPFPPDDRSIGYERGTSVSKAWDEATTEAAFEIAGYVATHLRELSGVADDAADRDARLREFCRMFTTRAFRRPLGEEQLQFFIDRQFKAAPNVETAVKRVVLLTLKSPRFLYREVGTAGASVAKVSTSETTAVSNPYDVASRLSFAMWDSMPDEQLLKAAAAGQLATRDQVLQHAQRMVTDPRARSKMRDFFLQWLKVDHYPDLAKDAKRFPAFDDAVASDLRTSLELSLEHIIWSPKSDFRELLLTDKFFLNGRLARVYGEILPANAPFQQVSMDYGRRAGILTHPYVLASFAYLDTSSPIHRGVLIARNLLGRTLQPPPQAFTPLPADLHPGMTTRQRVAMQTKPAACASCHTMINPLGFSLEKFDASGSLRARENGVPIDDSGGYQSRSGQEIKFTGPRDLANFLAGSEEVHLAFVQRMFQHTVKQPVKAFGPLTHSNLVKAFKANGFNIRQQMIESAVLSSIQQQTEAGNSGKMEETSQPFHKGIPKT